VTVKKKKNRITLASCSSFSFFFLQRTNPIMRTINNNNPIAPPTPAPIYVGKLETI